MRTAKKREEREKLNKENKNINFWQVLHSS